jgi:hypothetical protein
MTADSMGPAELPDAIAAELTSDLVTIVGHLVEQPGTAGPAGREGRVRSAGVMSRPAAGQAPGVVKVRLSGERADIDMIAAVLAGICQVLDRSGSRPNRYDPGERIYLTIRIGPAHPARPLHRT